MSSTTDPSGIPGLSGFIAGMIQQFGGGNNNNITQTQTAANMADPFASQYGTYQKQLLGLMQGGPGAIFQDPAFTSALNLGEEGVARQMGAAGFTGSGNEAAALQSYGQTFGLNFYNQQVSNLTALSGAAPGSPGTAGNIMSNLPGITNANTAGLTNSVMKLLASSGLPAAVINQIKQALGGGSGPGDSSGSPTGNPDQLDPSITDPGTGNPIDLTTDPSTDPTQFTVNQFGNLFNGSSTFGAVDPFGG
jgi:hypothetical protein